ncbi:hypothetical protein AX15_001925 [Amanita polypyramis BW_CC]|nr:hypothetical protein AX15_001925 [Amanita polypyramis BW_CC]
MSPPSSLLRHEMAASSTTFPRSGVLLLGSSSIQSLVPSTLISQVEALLDSHRIEEAIELADQKLRKLQLQPVSSLSSPVPISPSPQPHSRPHPQVQDETDELHYVYQRIGFQCFSETRFEDAGKLFSNGELDPRVLVSYYPGLRGGLFGLEDTVDLFQGVADKMPTEDSVEELIAANLVMNYSPHLSPNTRTAPVAVELRRVLVMAAEEMLEKFLRRWIKERRGRLLPLTSSSAELAKDRSKDKVKAKGKGKAVDPCFPVVDTILAKLYAQFEKTTELYALLQDLNYIVLSEVEETLINMRQYHALCILYGQREEDLKLLSLYAKLIDGEWVDDRMRNPVSDMMDLLQDKKDRALVQKWAIWLIKRDYAQGIKLLMLKDTGKRKDKPEDDIVLLDQVQAANERVGQEYLEYLVLQRRLVSPELHTRLAVSCAERVVKVLETDEAVAKLWRAKASSYASSQSTTETTFISHFASTTPDSESKRARLKLILFLAGSSLYDPVQVKECLSGNEKVLKIEFATLDARLGDHRGVLVNLVHEVGDAVSAEMYCMTGGGGQGIVTRKVAVSLAESGGLEVWVAGLFGGSGVGTRVDKSVDTEERKRLLKLLLEVHVNDTKNTPAQTTKFLDSQAADLNSIDVISLVPPDWPLRVLSSFLARSYRQTLHLQHQGKIVKNISAGQNLEVKDKTWYVLREEGYDIEEAVEKDHGGGGEGEGEGGVSDYDEKSALVEKLAMHLEEVT